MSEWKDIPAFPTTPVRDVQGKLDPDCYSGMTLRDYFAGECLQRVYWNTSDNQQTAKMCYDMADAMLKVRAQPPISEDI